MDRASADLIISYEIVGITHNTLSRPVRPSLSLVDETARRGDIFTDAAATAVAEEAARHRGGARPSAAGARRPQGQAMTEGI